MTADEAFTEALLRELAARTQGQEACDRLHGGETQNAGSNGEGRQGEGATIELVTIGRKTPGNIAKAMRHLWLADGAVDALEHLALAQFYLKREIGRRSLGSLCTQI